MGVFKGLTGNRCIYGKLTHRVFPIVYTNGVGVVMGFLYMAVFALFSNTTFQKIRVVAMLGMTAFICRVSFGIMLK